MTSCFYIAASQQQQQSARWHIVERRLAWLVIATQLSLPVHAVDAWRQWYSGFGPYHRRLVGGVSIGCTSRDRSHASTKLFHLPPPPPRSITAQPSVGSSRTLQSRHFSDVNNVTVWGDVFGNSKVSSKLVLYLNFNGILETFNTLLLHFNTRNINNKKAVLSQGIRAMPL